jgi:hypothetical protein
MCVCVVYVLVSTAKVATFFVLAAGFAEAFTQLGPAAGGMRLLHGAVARSRSAWSPALRMSADEEYDEVFARVNMRAEIEPMQLIMAFLEHSYSSSPACRSIDVLEESFQNADFKPIGNIVNFCYKATSPAELHDSLVCEDGPNAMAPLSESIPTISALPVVSPAPSEDSDVRDVLARVQAMEEQHPSMTPTKNQRWSREHSLQTCCQWEKKHVAEKFISDLIYSHGGTDAGM